MSAVQPVISMFLSCVVCITVVFFWLHRAHLSSVADDERWTPLRHAPDHDVSRGWLKSQERWKRARVSQMFDMVAERRLNDAQSGSVDGVEGSEYLKEVIASWKAELQKIYDDTVGTMDKDLTPSKGKGELQEFDFKVKEDYHAYNCLHR